MSQPVEISDEEEPQKKNKKKQLNKKGSFIKKKRILWSCARQKSKYKVGKKFTKS